MNEADLDLFLGAQVFLWAGLVGKRKLTQGQTVEAGYFVYGGKAELQFVEVQSVDRKVKLN